MRQASLVSFHDEFWYEYFENDDQAEDIIEQVQRVAIESRFSRPDWNTLLTPLIMESQALIEVSDRLAQLREIMRSATRRLYGDDMGIFLRDAGFPAGAAAALDLPSAGLLPSRWDVLETTTGWKTVELNAGGALGVFAFDAVQSLYDDVLAEKGLAGSESWGSLSVRLSRDMSALMEAHRASRVAVVVDGTTAASYTPIARVVAGTLSGRLGVAVELWDEAMAAEAARSAGSPILAYQCCSIADRAASPQRYADYDSAVRDGAILQAIDPMADVLASKAVMAMTWRAVEEGLLEDGQSRLVEALLPHTVFIGEADRVGAADDRHDWVLKTAFGHGGYEVRCGWELGREEWEASLRAARDDGGPLAILQRRLRGIDRQGIGMTPDGTLVHMMAPKLLGLFQQGDAFGGACARQSPHNGGVVSVGAGAALGVVRSVAASPGDRSAAG
jgi:hypothetical protein